MQSSIQFKVSSKGFTLMEIMLVIAILAILAAVVIIAINPTKQLAKSRDAERTTDVYSILASIHRYAAEHDGDFPQVITTENLEICRTDSLDCTGLYDLSALTDEQEFLVVMPVDPLCADDGLYCSSNGTGYFVAMTDTEKIILSAPYSETSESISVTR